MTKAYRNPEFLNSAAARPLRILAEYLEPKQRLEALGVTRAIAFWGSARIRPEHEQMDDGRDYYRMAMELCRRLAEWTTEQHPHDRRFHILTGAGPGIMEAAHAGAAAIDPKLNIGLNISLPYEQNVNPYIPAAHVFEFHYFFTRKFWFIELAQALVVFPGGFGTLDELFEVLTLMQTGKLSRRPVVLFGSEYWNDVINLPALARQGLIEDNDLTMVTPVDDVDAAFEFLVSSLGS